MSARPRTDRTTRREALASVAGRLFAERGVANTAVSDIVKAAGVAQGTFYLYFDSKDDVILAVVGQVVEKLFSAVEAAISSRAASAPEKLLALGHVFAHAPADPAAIELVGILHDPANRALHDRLAESLVPRLLPLVEDVVAQGVSEGSFDVPDTHAAAWFVLGGLQSAELAGTPPDKMPDAIEAATALALRALGHREALA